MVPIYRNEENIADLVKAVTQLDNELGGLECIFVVDGSPDSSGQILLEERPNFNFDSKVIFLSKNFGSFTAIRTGLEYASGRSIAVMAADLQEPPELIFEFFKILEASDVDVVFGQRMGRNDSLLRDTLSNIFWWLYGKLIVKDVPKGGVDIFACNQIVAGSVLEISEPNSSLIAQLFWVGFRRKFVPYQRLNRIKGRSSWNFSKRLRYMMDSIFSFSDLPIMLVLWGGLLGCLLSLGFGIFVAIARIFGLIEIPGYAALVVLLTFSVSIILAVQGIIGCYLWRTFENSKRRPLRIISRIEDS